MAASNAAGADRTTDRPRQDQNQTDHAIVHDLGVEHKVFVTLRAEAARRGMGLYRIPEGYLLSWGSTFRELPTLPEVGALLARLGDSK